MTGGHAAGPTAPPEEAEQVRPRRPLAWRIGTPLVALVSGALFVVSAADSGGTDLRPGRYTDLASLVEAEAADYEQLQERVRELNAKVDELSEDVSSGNVARIRGQIEQMEDPAGLEPRRGPGMTITMSDAPDDQLDEALEANYTADRLVVHQQDLQAVVNALWSGGATAITIAGQRIVSTTGIKCEGNAVQLQGVPYPQPYVIQAVGDQADLLTALDSDPLVAGYRADAANPVIDLGWDVELEDEIEAPAYDGLLDLRYAEPLR